MMQRWAVIVAILYSLMLGVLSAPFAMLAFVPEVSFKNAVEIYGEWQWWLWLVVMGLAQAALLAAPVRVANRRPMTRRPLALTILASGLMMGGLVTGAVYSLCEFALANNAIEKPDGFMTNWMALGLGVAEWCVWALIFFRLSRTTEPHDLVSRQCQWLLKGSILELLIAVPTHIVARCRDYCCAGLLTFVGLTLGMSVMLFSFGPGVFFLFVARWRRLRPSQEQRDE
jgi:hypothetical protein